MLHIFTTFRSFAFQSFRVPASFAALALLFLTLPLVCAAQGKIAFTSFRDGNQEIYVMNADGSNQINLTNNLGFDSNPSFSPNGSKIAFRACLKSRSSIQSSDHQANHRRINHRFACFA